MAVVRQQERVLNSVLMSVSAATGTSDTRQDERELVDREAHDHRDDTGDDGVPAGGSADVQGESVQKTCLLFPNILAYTSCSSALTPSFPLSRAGHPNAVAKPTK